MPARCGEREGGSFVGFELQVVVAVVDGDHSAAEEEAVDSARACMAMEKPLMFAYCRIMCVVPAKIDGLLDATPSICDE